MKHITVFGASSDDISEKYKQSAYDLGRLIAQKNWKQYNGGGAHGIMGYATKGGLDHNGEVHGIIIEVYKMFEAKDLTSCISVEGFHERKQGLIDAGDAIIVMPGGVGTLSEAFHVIDDLLADIARGVDQFIPLIFVNINSFFSPLFDWIEVNVINERFLKQNLWNQVVQLVANEKEAIAFIETKINNLECEE